MHITNKISNAFHKFATKQFSKPVQSFINKAYVNLLGLDMREFNDPASYESLSALFTRELRVPRDIDSTLDSFISPADSFVTQCGDVKEDTALQIKGMSYSVKELITNNFEQQNVEKLHTGKYMNFYLSPKDYHRYHSSYNCQITKLVHIPGKLYPVNFTYLKKQKNLFIENERVILECKTMEGKIFYMVFVGALNVGKMAFTFEPAVNTNAQIKEPQVFEYDDLHLNKGDCMGYFEMGSTVVIFWEDNFVELENLINKKVRFSDTIAKTI